MKHKFVTSAAALAIGVSGLVGLAATPAFAGGVTITAGSGSSANCDITAGAKLVPALKNDWTQATGDSGADGAAFDSVPTTVFSTTPVYPPGEVTTAKGESYSGGAGNPSAGCSGTATDGVNTASIIGIKKFSLASESQNSPPGGGAPTGATCSALLADAAGGTAGMFDATIEWTSGTAGTKIANTTITGETLGAGGSGGELGFVFSGGTITGSFAGGSVSTLGAVSNAVVAEISQGAETASNAEANLAWVQGGSVGPEPWVSLGCQPTVALKSKAGKNGGPTTYTASIKGPKGFSKIAVDPANSSLMASA